MATTRRDVEVRELVAADDLARCSDLYRSAFAVPEGDGAMNTRLLVGIARNSGIIVGALFDGELVGYALSFLAQDELGRCYQYSQNAAVSPSWQGQGIGRRLKLAQRAIALGRGVTVMRWAFDPLQARNAHFNLDVLGARGVAVERDFYGVHGNGLGEDATTHRLIAEWLLDSARVAGLADSAAPAAPDLPDAPEIGALRRLDGGADLVVPDLPHGLAARGPASREAIVAAMEGLIGEGLVATSCRRAPHERYVYHFEPAESPGEP